MPRYTDEEIIQILRGLAERLGKTTLSKKDIASVISPSTLACRFGNVGNALEAAGLERGKPHSFRPGPQIKDRELFSALYEVERSIGHEPGYSECSAHCIYSVRPYRTRFGKWPDVLAHYRKWKSENEHSLTSDITEAPEAGPRAGAKRICRHKIPVAFP